MWDFRVEASEGASVDFEKTSIVEWREDVERVQLKWSARENSGID